MKQSFLIPENCKTVTVEQDGNKIVCTFEEKFIPKDGDFCFIEDWNTIFIHNGKTNEKLGWALYYCFISDHRSGVVVYGKDSTGVGFGKPRLATESEKQTLLDALAKDGKRWDAENKKVVKLRWRAEKFGGYYYIHKNVGGKVYVKYSTDDYSEVHGLRFKDGNYKKTSKEAQDMADRINAIYEEQL